MKILALALCLSVSGFAATVDGIPIHSTAYGSGAKTVVFVHGWTCDETSWQEQIKPLEKSYRLITIDLPGHGKSGAPKTGELSMALFAKAIEAVRAEAGANKIVLVGHSMGVPVIRQYARMFPTHVAGLVPVDGVLKLSGSANAPNAEFMRGPNGVKAREGMIRGMFSKSTTPPMQEHILHMMLAAPESTAYQAMAATFAPANWTEDVVTVPVMGVYADHSTAGDATYMKKIFPNSEYHEVAGTGHFLMMEKPAEFNGLLLGFLPKAQY